MRLALISDTYPPMRTSGAVQMRDLAHELSRQGHRPCVITSAPKLDRSWRLTVEDEVQVLRIRTLATKDVSYIERALAEFLMPFSMMRQIARTPVADEKWDGVVWYSPNIFFGPLVWRLKRRSKCQAYLILRDIFPQWALDAGLLSKGMIYGWFKLNERYQYSVADVIGVQSKSSMDYFSDADLRAGQRLEVLNNWLAETGIVESHIPEFMTSFEQKTILVYAGNMGVAQGMDSLLNLACCFKDDSDIVFLFVGRGSEVGRMRTFVEEYDLLNVFFFEEIDPADIQAMLSKCHVGLIELHSQHKTHNIPGKFLAYLQAGLPVLARINAGNDLQELICDEKVGRVSVGTDSPELLLVHAWEFVNNADVRKEMGCRGRELWKRLFSCHCAATQLVQALRSA